MSYKIEVSMTPAYHDCPNAPYFWCILRRKDNETMWSNYGHGWARTPTEAWQKAYLYWDDITSL